MKGIGGMLRVGAYNIEWFDDLTLAQRPHATRGLDA